MTKMLTLFGKDIGKLKYNDLKREMQTQKFIRMLMKKALTEEKKKNQKRKATLAQKCNGINERSVRISDDKITLLETYVNNLNATIKEIEYHLSRKSEPLTNATDKHSKKRIRETNAQKRTKVLADNTRDYYWKQSIERDGLITTWNRDKFMQVASDNGYQTEEALIHATAKELQLDRGRAKTLLDKGRFTWGQVLCLGAMLQMTPREFCDVFLSDYFVDHYGAYVADYENVSKSALLKHAIKPSADRKLVEVEVGADGKPLDEEVWFE